MLTIKPIANAVDASHYYQQQDNYYLSDKESLDKLSGWLGKGAISLGLSGEIIPSQFLSLLSGKLPTGKQIGVTDANGAIKHRPGTDITLSPPKSLSILALVGEDERLVQAHNKAVEATIDAIESIAAEARITSNGKTEFEKTNNVVVARFRHTTSRELDPLLHDHAIFLNMTQSSDGKWRALSSRSKFDKENTNNGFREMLYHNQHYFGLVYNTTLAKETCEIGYDIEIQDKYGNFEILGVPKEFIKSQSKRREQILSHLSDKGLSSASAAEISNLETRRVKSSVDSKALLAYWKKNAENNHVDLDEIINLSKNKDKGISKNNLINISQNAKDAINDAILHLSIFQTKIRHLDLVRMAHEFSCGAIYHLEIEKEIEQRFKDRALLGEHLEYYTTDMLLQKEKNFIEGCKQGIETSFSKETNQLGMAASILGQKNRIQLIDVKGVKNEKSLIESIIHQSESIGVNAYVLHVGKVKVNQLSQTISRDNSTLWQSFKNFFKPELVQTVTGFMQDYNEKYTKNCTQNDLFIVHDAQKLSYQEIESLNNLAKRTESKLILLNNIKSTEGFSAGSPIKALKEAGFHFVESIQSEKKATINITQATNADNYHHELVKHYFSIDDDKRKDIQVVALTNKDYQLLCDEIRTNLQNSGKLSFQTKEIAILSTKTLSEPQKKHMKFYAINDKVTFNPYKKGQEEFRVIDKNEKILTLKNSKGDIKKIDLEKEQNFQVNKTDKMAISIGEQLMVEKNSRIGRLYFSKGDKFSIKSIDPNGANIQHKDGTVYFSNDELSQLTLSYQYVKKPNTMIEQSNEMLVSAKEYQFNKNILGELEEFSKKIHIFTDNKEKAIEKLDKSQINLTISDVAEKKASHIYRDITYAKDPLYKDLDNLSRLLARNETRHPDEIAELAVSYATAKLAERDAAFEHNELMTQSMVFALGHTSLKDIEKAIDEKSKAGELIHSNTKWISKNALELENKIVENNVSNKNTLTPIVEYNQLLSLPSTLSQGQKDAITLALTTKDRFTSVQGLAGVGKTTMMEYIQSIANQHNFNVIGLAPMHTSKDEMIAVGIQAMTIAQFLTDATPVAQNTILIVDEASMVGNRDYLAIQEKTKQSQARAIYTGDITQLQSPSSGIPHELTIKTKTQDTAYMTEIIRQKNSPDLKEAIIHASKDEIKDAFEKINAINPESFVQRKDNSNITNNQPFSQSSIIEIACKNIEPKSKKTDYNPIYDAIATDYLTRTPEHQGVTLVIAHTHNDRKEINARIRQGLQKQGSIQNEDIKTERLHSKSMTKAELMHVQNYQTNDIIRFDANYSLARKGAYFTVTTIDKENNHLHCMTDKDETFIINPASYALKARMSVHTKEVCPLSQGDTIRLRLTDKNRGHIANREYNVKEIKEKTVFLKNTKTEETLSLNLDEKKDSHWDYAYTRTAFAAQSATETFVIALELSKRMNATTHRSHLIDITRPRLQVSIYTDDKSSLIDRLATLEGDKNSAYLTRVRRNCLKRFH